MKKSEIVVGQKYAASRNNSYRPDGRSSSFSAQGVEVLSEATSRKEQRYPYRVTSVVRVRALATGTEYDCPTREIREPWEQYEADALEWAKARRASMNRQAAGRRERAAGLTVLVEALEAAGVPTEAGYVYDPEIRRLMSEAIPGAFDFAEGGEPSTTFRAPLARSLPGYVKEAKALEISADVLIAVLP